MKSTKTWSPEDYKKYKNKWANKKEYETTSEVRDRLSEMTQARQTSCPFASPYSDKSVTESNEDLKDLTKGSGTDWSDHWNRMLKIAHKYGEYDQQRSNVKSATTFAPIQALMAEFQENNIGVMISSTQEEDKEKIKLHDAIHTDWESRTDAQKYKGETFFETITLGTSIPFVGWMSKSREVDIILTGKEAEKKLESDDEETKDKIDKMVKEFSPLVEKQKIYEYNNVIYVPTSLYEIYVDPDARCLRGPAYEATDICWVQLPSIEQFRAEFKNSSDPFVKKGNIDKVEPAIIAEGQYEGNTPFFKAPHGISDKRIQLIRYFNKQTDKYIIIANDVIVRDGPLPYNHKQLPFVLHKCFNWKDQFYGYGLPAALEQTQSVIETFTNLQIDKEKVNMMNTSTIYVGSDIVDDVQYGQEEMGIGRVVEVGGDVNNMKWGTAMNPSMDFYRMREIFDQDAVMISGINPMAYSAPKQGEPVRTHMMSMESTLKLAKKIFRNWAEGWKEAVRQMITIRTQMLPVSYIEEMGEEGEMKKVYPTIKTKGFTMNAIQGENGEMDLMEQENETGEDGYFNLGLILEDRDKYLDITGDLDIQVDIDTLVPTSKAVKIELSNKAMAQYIPILSNPQLLSAPGVITLLRENAELNGISPKFAESLQDTTDEADVERATQQEEQMQKLMTVPGIPGESDGHKFVHTTTLLNLFGIREQAQLNPQETTVQNMAELDQYIKLLANHLAQDDAQRKDSTGMAIKQATPPAPQQMMPQMPDQMMGQVPGGMPGGMDMMAMGAMQGMPQGMPGGIPGGMPGGAPMM